MRTLLLTDQSNPGCIIPERRRAMARLATHVRARALDRALAAGASPDSSAALSMRAQMLIGNASRASLARMIRRLIEDARHPLNPLTPHVPLCRGKIMRSARTLEQLATRLLDGEPVNARGVAQIRVLLVGDCGVLCENPRADDLCPIVSSAGSSGRSSPRSQVRLRRASCFPRRAYRRTIHPE
jgi:hypothetical protein